MSPLAKLMMLLREEAPAQADRVREALRRTMNTGLEHSVIGPAMEDVRGSSIGVGKKDSVVPNRADYDFASASGQPILDFHTHPLQPGETSSVVVAPSAQDLYYYPGAYEHARRGVRTLIAQPPLPSERKASAFNFFETDRPQYAFDPSDRLKAVLELQHSAYKGAFDPVVKSPDLVTHFEAADDLGDVIGDFAPLALLRRRAEQGLGRSVIGLPSQPISPFAPQVSWATLYDRLQPIMLEELRRKKLARGGSV